MTELTKLLLVADVGDAGLLRTALREVSGDNLAFGLVHVFCLADALQRLTDEPFDLILLDLSLPDGHGIATVARIRSVVTDVPIVILTALEDQEVAIEAMRLGAQNYLIKGQIEGRTLVRAIRYAIERSRADTQLQQQRARQSVLQQVNLAMTSSLDLQSVLDTFLDTVKRLLPEFAITVRLLDPENGVLQPLACRSVDEASWRRDLPGVGGMEGARAALKLRSPIVAQDALAGPRSTTHHDFLRHNGLLSYVGVPLLVKGEALGLVTFYTRVRREFPSEEVEFLADLADQAATAIHNSQLHERLKQALEIKKVLVGVMAHELKTPLQVIMGASSLLSTGMCGELTQDQNLRVAAIERGADELLKLIENTLTTARVEQGKTNVVVSTVSVGSLLAEVKSEFAEAFTKKGLDLDVQVPFPDVTMYSDRNNLKGILRNLVENARKFTPQGKVEVVFASDDANQRVEFIVRDTGIGIQKEVLPKIFELFYQAEQGLVAEQASAGLGLNIVKRLVSAMSGEIDVASEVGAGTTFRVYLPREITSTHVD